ncbi:MFS transporter [Kitasatospora cineracea]|uniref:MFS transporter n=1 Tax=Kitasatospora cineracea TaxID=88074 RepID=A0A8G1XER0_9ACTN|nr:MFS transporter [Kitasatospora cineracea]ROR46443.1 hypothetical protein EDD39_4713 [Kitasatospora cineracea]
MPGTRLPFGEAADRVEHRRLAAALAAGFAGRLPLGVVTVLLLVAGAGPGHSLGTAAAASAMAVVGLAVGAPLQGRLLDRRPPSRVLGCYAALQGAVLLVLAAALTRPPEWPVVLLAFVQGATVPALSPCVRLVLRHHAGPDGPGRAFTVDAVLTEVVHLAGPALAAVGAALVGPPALLAGCAVLVATGAAGFLAAVRPGWLRPDDRHAGPPGGSGPVRGFLLAAALLAAPFGVAEAALTARAAELGTGPGPVGAALTALGLGSVLGGTLYGLVRPRPYPGRRFRLLALALGAGLSTPALAAAPPATLVLFSLTGLCVSPLAGLTTEILDRLTRPGPGSAPRAGTPSPTPPATRAASPSPAPWPPRSAPPPPPRWPPSQPPSASWRQARRCVGCAVTQAGYRPSAPEARSGRNSAAHLRVRGDAKSVSPMARPPSDLSPGGSRKARAGADLPAFLPAGQSTGRGEALGGLPP